MFRNIQVPHMGRAISVVVMMETIFLLGVFAEIYVTTAGGPGIATTNLAFLIYQRALLAFNVGSASAAGVIAIVLANIIAAFLVAHRGPEAGRMKDGKTCAHPIAGTLCWLGRAVHGVFPILWMVLASFKTEVRPCDAARAVLRADGGELPGYLQRAELSALSRGTACVISLAATVLMLLVAVPAAFAMAFYPTRRTRGHLLWMLSTKMLPAVGVLVPIYLLVRDVGLLDSVVGADHRSTCSAICRSRCGCCSRSSARRPKDIIEASRIDGASLGQVIVHVLLPLVATGHRVDRAAVDHSVLERGVLEPQPVGARMPRRCRRSLPRFRRRRGCSGPSFRPRPRWRSRRFWCWAGSASASLCAG